MDKSRVCSMERNEMNDPYTGPIICGLLAGIWYLQRLIFREIRKLRNQDPRFSEDEEKQ